MERGPRERVEEELGARIQELVVAYRPKRLLLAPSSYLLLRGRNFYRRR
jgi:hypothetical protein